MTKKLVIESVDNPDWNGTWFKENVEQDLKELVLITVENTWIYWILDHVIDAADFTESIEQLYVENDAVRNVTLKLKDGTVKISKHES